MFPHELLVWLRLPIVVPAGGTYVELRELFSLVCVHAAVMRDCEAAG